MTNSTSEREQRLREIRERSESRKRVAGKFQWAQVSTQEWADIDFLLSLLDSEAVVAPEGDAAFRQCGDVNGKPLEVILGQLGSPASREDVEKLRCLIEDIRRDERAAALSSRDTEIREVLEGLVTHQIGSRRPCWCPLDYGSEPHTELCEAARALYATLQPDKKRLTR